ncbi:MAG: hypothetical protein HON70_17255, partial [Lentisphaerae bacterium]|nr:hypothetical protein [Lentisphaerota bacterium]
DHGVLCPIKSPEALADGMHRVLSDAALRTDLVERAHAVALDVHSSERVTEEYLKLFEGMLKTAGNTPEI